MLIARMEKQDSQNLIAPERYISANTPTMRKMTALIQPSTNGPGSKARTGEPILLSFLQMQ